MHPERRQQIEDLFEAALEKSPGDRDAFLAEACRDDAELHAEVIRLLEAHERGDGILEHDLLPAAPFLVDVQPREAREAERPEAGASDGGPEVLGPPSNRVVAPARVGPDAARGTRARPVPIIWILTGIGYLSIIGLAILVTARFDWAAWIPTTVALVGLPLAAGFAWGLGAARTRGNGTRHRTGRGGRDDKRVVGATGSGGLAVGSQIGRYRVLERLGVGGMGVVYRARDTTLDRHVALKFLPAHLSADPQARERFLVEAQAAAALDHPNICTIHEIGSTEDGRLYIVMALYEGATVQERLEKGPLPAEEAVEIAIQVARGLARAHAHDIIHRDIKPANILVTRDGIAKLLDFGVAKLSGIDITRTGAAVGTISYMSPEQVRGDAVTARTDIWALGVVLYEMLAGRRPFRGEERIGVLHAILNEEPRPLRELCPDLPAAVDATVRRCLARDPDARPSDMTELIEMLAGEAVQLTADILPRGRRAASARGSAVRAPADVAELPPEGERRPASILVTTIDRYVDLVEGLAPEELDRLLERVREAIAEVVAEYGGIVNSGSDGETVALFGIPVGYEDSLPRAVWAALAIHARIRETEEGPDRVPGPIQLRSGIATGVVVARPNGGRGHRYRIAGTPAEIAERLAAHADPGEILIDQDCQDQATPFFETEPDEPFSLHGSERPLTPYRVIRQTGLQTRIDAAESQGLTEYAGRDSELRRLDETLERAIRGEGGLVTVIGEAGVGKSRLLLEFRKRLDRGRVLVLRGRCQPFGGGVPYLPFIDALRSRLGLEEDGVEVPTAGPVLDAIQSIGPGLDDFIPIYLHLLSIEDDEHPLPAALEGEDLRSAILDALSAAFTIGSRKRPTVLLLEDWHWADRASSEVLIRLGEMAGTHPLLIVTTARPDPELQFGTPARHVPLHLGPLDADSSTSIVGAVLGADELPDDLVATLYERTGGNPFFLEELSKALRESGAIQVEEGRAHGSVKDLDLPDTVQGVLRTRLDRLDRRAREVVRHAAVIGREFTRSILERTLPAETTPLDESLDALRRLGLIQQTRVLPDPAYRFKHALTLEAAYDSLIPHQRRTLHGQVGAAIEEVFADRLDEHADRLAHHFSQAEDWAKAVHYGRQAADRAQSFSRFHEALEMLDATLDWTDRLGADVERTETRIEILFRQERLGEILGERGRQAELIDELLAILERGEPDSRLAEAYLRRGDLHTLMRRFDVAEEALNDSLAIARTLSDRMAERNALRSLGLLRWHQGRNEEAIELAEAALAIDRENGDLEGIVVGLSNLGNIHKSLGNHEQALEHLYEGVRLVEGDGSMGEPRLKHKLSYLLHNIANNYRALGEIEKAYDYLEWASSVDTGYMTPIQQSFHLTAMANIRLQQGRIEDCLTLYRRAVDGCRRARAAEGLSQSLRALGTVLDTLGRHEEAVPHLVEAAGIFESLGDVGAELSTRMAAATACEKLGRHRDARSAWERVRDLARQADDRERELQALEGLARRTREDDPQRAREYYRTALDVARDLGDGKKQGALLNSLGILEWNQEAYEEALACYQEALTIFQALDDRVHEGLALNSLAATLRRLGRRAEAEERIDQALAVNRETGEALLEAHSLALRGELRHQSGDAEQAAIDFGESLRLRRELGDRLGAGWMLCRLARVQAGLGARQAARSSWTEAVGIAQELGNEELARACEELNLFH